MQRSYVRSLLLWTSTTFCWQLDGDSFVLLLFSHKVVSNSLQPRGLQHARLSCPSPSPEVCSNSCPLNWWWLFVYYSFITRKSSFPLRFRQNWVISSPTVKYSKDRRIPSNIFRFLPGWAIHLRASEWQTLRSHPRLAVSDPGHGVQQCLNQTPRGLCHASFAAPGSGLGDLT